MGSPSKKPSGPYADKLWREALRRAVLKRIEKNQRIDLIAEKVASLAESGDMMAAREIGDRLDGKPAQTQDITISDERSVVRAPAPADSPEAWQTGYKPH